MQREGVCVSLTLVDGVSQVTGAGAGATPLNIL